MMVRRIASAFRRQDWFTVAVEIMIVVLGVDFLIADRRTEAVSMLTAINLM